MMTINDWKQEANQQMKQFACKDSEKFAYWMGFFSGLEKATFCIKQALEE